MAAGPAGEALETLVCPQGALPFHRATLPLSAVAPQIAGNAPGWVTQIELGSKLRVTAPDPASYDAEGEIEFPATLCIVPAALRAACISMYPAPTVNKS